MEHLYTKKQAEQLRQKIIEVVIIPIIKANFKKYPELQSAALLIAQYWCDEARDAVHDNLIYSVLDTPNFEAWTNALKYSAEDSVNLPKLSKHGTLKDKIWYIPKTEGRQYYWSENHDAIPAFAAFCKEGSHQCMATYEAYTPYCVFRRLSNDIEIEVIGKMLRPWLDGMKPVW